MQLEKLLKDFIENADYDPTILIEMLSKYILKVFGHNDKIGDIDDIKQEIYLFLSNKRSVFSKYTQNLDYIIKRSIINHFKDILRKKTISVVDKELDPEILETSLIKHTETEFITKIDAANKLNEFTAYFSDKEKDLLVHLINNTQPHSISKAAFYKAKERLVKKIKKAIYELNLDYQTADVMLDYMSKNIKISVNRDERKE